jgi:hypothetical protein
VAEGYKLRALGRQSNQAYGDAEYFGSSVRNLLHVALLAPKILQCNLDFWKICAPRLNGIILFSYMISSGGAVD